MSRHRKIKYISPTLPVRKLARWMYQSWDEVIQGRLGAEESTWIPFPLRSDTQRIERDTLAATICLWVEELGIQNAEETWKHFLTKARSSRIIQKGYGKLAPPHLSWVFLNYGKGRGIDRIMDGVFQNCNEGGFVWTEDHV